MRPKCSKCGGNEYRQADNGLYCIWCRTFTHGRDLDWEHIEERTLSGTVVIAYWYPE